MGVLQDAQALVQGDRQEDYGHPASNFQDIADGWQVIFRDGEVNPERCALAMVWVKICREVHKPKKDNRVDGAAYFEVVDMIIEERKRRKRGDDGSAKPQ